MTGSNQPIQQAGTGRVLSGTGCRHGPPADQRGDRCIGPHGQAGRCWHRYEFRLEITRSEGQRTGAETRVSAPTTCGASSGLAQELGRGDRQVADAAAGRVVDGVADRGGGADDADLADALARPSGSGAGRPPRSRPPRCRGTSAQVGDVVLGEVVADEVAEPRRPRRVSSISAIPRPMVMPPMNWERASRRVDDPAGGEHPEQPRHPHLAGARVDAHLGELGAERVPGERRRPAGHVLGSVSARARRRPSFSSVLAAPSPTAEPHEAVPIEPPASGAAGRALSPSSTRTRSGGHAQRVARRSGRARSARRCRCRRRRSAPRSRPSLARRGRRATGRRRAG